MIMETLFEQAVWSEEADEQATELRQILNYASSNGKL